MASITNVNGLTDWLNGTFGYLTADMRMMLVLNTYVPDPTHTNVNNGGGTGPANHEISVSGYTPGFSGTGRKVLAGKTVVTNTPQKRTEIDANDVTYTSLGAGATVRYAIIYRHNTSDANSRILFVLDLATTALPTGIPTDGSNFVVQLSGAGLGVAF